MFETPLQTCAAKHHAHTCAESSYRPANMQTKKAAIVPPSSFSEPSEPSQVRPEDRPKETLRGTQEENPQLVAHDKGRQAADARGGRHPGKDNSRSDDDPARAEEEKRADVAGGFGVGRSKL
ncbi:hypothetical protein BD413DRAFT_611414 [Trametes elegans]|nr:hypothetical protein BD413DRAFT_611414 [Trametes elegans]